MNDEWTDWIEHDGKGCPCPGQWFRGVFECYPGKFEEHEGRAGSMGALSWDWRYWLQLAPNGELAARLIRYRIRKPRALAQLRQMIADIKQPEDVV